MISHFTPLSISQTHSQHNSTNAANLILLIVDGIGLAIIAGCTILEGAELWNSFFNEYATSNPSSLCFWFCGRFLQLAGLMLLIAYAATFQMFPELERGGMLLLTAGPVLNLASASFFHSSLDPYFLFNKRWTSSEVLELLGIVVLDISLIEMEEVVVLSAEISGFFILACAALIDFEFFPGEMFPVMEVRWDLLHVSDSIGLGLLTLVAVGQFFMKSHIHQQQQLLLHNQQLGVVVPGSKSKQALIRI